MRSWRNQRASAGRRGQRCVSPSEEKEIAQRSSLQQASEIRPRTPSTERTGDEFLEYVVTTQIMENRREWMKSTGEKRDAQRGEERHVSEAAHQADAE